MDYQEKVKDLDCIYVLSGGMRKNENGIVVPGDFETLDHHGLLSEGESRCQAAAYLWQLNKQIKLISSGRVLPFGYPELKDQAQYSAVYKHELIRLGISPDSVLESTEPNDTCTELISLIEFISKYSWKKVLVMCNRAQLARTKLLFNIIQNYSLDNNLSDGFEISVKFFNNRLVYRQEQLLTPVFLSQLAHFKLLKTEVEILASEDVVVEFEPQKEEFYQRMYQTEGMQTRIQVDMGGVEDILNGVYYLPKS
jgi:hypothetical protein